MTATGTLTSLAPQARVGFALVPTEGPDSDAEMDAWTLMFEGAVEAAGGERVGEATWVGSVWLVPLLGSPRPMEGWSRLGPVLAALPSPGVAFGFGWALTLAGEMGAWRYEPDDVF